MNYDDINTAISGSFMQVQVQIRKWSGKATDKALSAQLEADKHAQHGSLRTVKSLMIGADSELKATNSALDSVRTYVYAHTLPWSTSTDVLRGPRLLPVSQSMDFLREYKALVQAYEQAKAEFLNVYDSRRQQAINNLGNAGNASDYPTRDDMDSKFHVDIDIGVVPETSDFSRMPIPADVAQHLGARMAQKQETALKNAMNDLFGRVLEQVNRMAVQLAKHSEEGKARLYKSLVGNMRDLCSLLEASNITNDERLSQLISRINDQLCAHEVEVLKANPTKAGQVAAQATIIAKEVESLVEWY